MRFATVLWLPLSLTALMLVGCATNAVYFHETTKFALAVEYKPDSSQPVSLTLGYKRRIAAVVPPKEPAPAGQADQSEATHRGEALSLVATFDVEGAGIQGATIKNFFASGMAAQTITSLPPEKATRGIKTLFAPPTLVKPDPALQPRKMQLRDKLDKLTEAQAQQILGLAKLSLVQGKNAVDSLRDHILDARDAAAVMNLESAFARVLPE